MSNIKIAGFPSNLFEELNDADLVAVTGGGIVDSLVSAVPDPNQVITPRLNNGFKSAFEITEVTEAEVTNNVNAFVG